MLQLFIYIYDQLFARERYARSINLGMAAAAAVADRYSPTSREPFFGGTIIRRVEQFARSDGHYGGGDG